MNQTDSLILKALKFYPKWLIEENGINLSKDVLLSPPISPIISDLITLADINRFFLI